MKKIVLLFLMFFGINTAISGYDSVEIKYSELPKNAREFIEEHFMDLEFTKASRNEDSFMARFGNTAQIDFDYFGNWTNVVTYQEGGVPKKIIPKRINKYIDTEIMGGHYVVQIKSDAFGYEVSMENGLELKFSKKGVIR